MPDSVLPYGWMLFGAVAFSLMAAQTHALGQWVDWQVVATARTAIALVLATALTRLAGVHLVFWGPRALWVRSIAGTVSLLCTFYALPRLPVGDALTLFNIFPMWVALLSWPLLGEMPTRDAWLAITCGMAGVVLVAQPHFTADRWLPVAAAVVSSLSTSVSMLGLHRLGHIDPRAIVVHFSAVSLAACLGSLALTPTAFWSESSFQAESLALLVGVGVCATVGQVFLTKAFAAGPPAKVSVVALTQVAFGMGFDLFNEGYSFSLLRPIGILLVLAPTAWLILSQGRLLTDDL